MLHNLEQCSQMVLDDQSYHQHNFRLQQAGRRYNLLVHIHLCICILLQLMLQNYMLVMHYTSSILCI